jgi:dTDP-glucose 4,6-dehydratase
MKNTKIMCTGSGGHIFSNFIRRAIYQKLDYNFVSIDKVKKSNAINNFYTNKLHKFYIGDVADSHFLNVIFEIERPDIVIHGAAELDDPNAFIHSNVTGTQTIIDACLKWNIERFIYISDDGVYGRLKDDSEASWTESSPINPVTFYAATKAAGELLVMKDGNKLPYNILRLCNSYGPRQTPTKFIPKSIKNILSDQSTIIWGNGTNDIRDWTHVNDIYSAIIAVLNSGKINDIYNVSAGQEFTNIEVYQEICNVLNKGHSLTVFSDAADVYRMATNSNKLKGIGWAPEYKFKNSIPEITNWYSSNQWALK